MWSAKESAQECETRAKANLRKFQSVIKSTSSSQRQKWHFSPDNFDKIDFVLVFRRSKWVFLDLYYPKSLLNSENKLRRIFGTQNHYLRIALAEFFGTFILCLIGLGAVHEAQIAQTGTFF